MMRTVTQIFAARKSNKINAFHLISLIFFSLTRPVLVFVTQSHETFLKIKIESRKDNETYSKLLNCNLKCR